MSINEIIKKLRKETGLTQKELAERTGLSLKSIINYENGLREPNSKAMAALEQFFNVSGAFLRGETRNRRTQKEEDRVQSMIQTSKEDMPDFIKRIQAEIDAVSDDDLEFVDGILVDLFLALRKKDHISRSSTLLLMHLSAHISTIFFDIYLNNLKNSSKEESIDEASKIILEYHTEALKYVKKFLTEQELVKS